jgi:cellulase/cellobiase CelA1
VTVPHAIAAAPPKVHTAPSVSCRVDYEMLAQWVFGFTAEVTIVNTGTSAIAGWTLRFDLQPGQTVGGGWSGQWKQDGSAVTVSDATYNGAVPPGGSVMIGFVGNQSGNTPAAPTHFTLNGAACN